MTTRKVVVMLAVMAMVGSLWVGQALCQQRGGGDRGGAREGGDRGGDRGGDQGRGRFDPAQFRQQMLDRMKTTLGASDEEWQALAPRVEKVMTLSRETRGGGRMMAGGMAGRRGGPRPGGDNAPAPAPDASETDKASQALATTLENKDAQAGQIKAALDGLRDARAKARERLAVAQKELKEVLTVRQEAQLVMMGMLE